MARTDDAAVIQDLLRDAFTRLIEHVDEITEGLTEEVSSYRPTPDANSIAWLLWHSARVQDLQLADVAGVEQVWLRDGWVDR
ncbi:mycothiol transferase, partial [Mycobacterium tuberculosis]|nr:mycothiol transferase [Mycobacterium tuberculosis]